MAGPDVEAEHELVAELPRLLDGDPAAGALELFFQPEVDLSSGEIAAMEALLRWHHPRRGTLAAARFLPAAAAAGYRGALAAWALDACAAEAARWQRAAGPYPPVVLWVNVAAEQLADPQLPAVVADLVHRHHLHAGSLGLEVTEEQLATGGSRVGEQLAALQDAGVALAVDDFGSWHSSLATLGDLPVDGVKLDREFVRGVGDDLDDDSLVAAVIRIAHARDRYVVAEGVETWPQSARLLELGCDRAMGYLFSPPETAARARTLLRRAPAWARPGTTARVGGGAGAMRTMPG